MSDLITQLFDRLVRKLRDNPNAERSQLVSELNAELEADPQFAALLLTNIASLNELYNSSKAEKTKVRTQQL